MFKHYRSTVLTFVALTVPATTARAQDDLRHRLTFSIQSGVDNQVSGNVIESATGQTTLGVPINLTETSYDDVYGRMGFFKVGVGYRTTPRTDLVANFVISRSGAELVDIDWLVEEGLRDINSESSRWSFPILIGARLRF